MGDIADMILNGDLDEVTGEYLGEGDGYPRSIHHRDERYRSKRPPNRPVAEIEMLKKVRLVTLGGIQKILFEAGYTFIAIKEINSTYYLKTESGTVINIYGDGKINLQGKRDSKINGILGIEITK